MQFSTSNRAIWYNPRYVAGNGYRFDQQTASVAIYDMATARRLAETTWKDAAGQMQDLRTTAARQALAAQPTLRSTVCVCFGRNHGAGELDGVRIAISAAKGIAPDRPSRWAIIVGVPTLCVTAAP